MDNHQKILYRSRTNKVIAGVCGGLGEYFNLDPLLFRLLFLILFFAGLSGLWLYIILAILMPSEPQPGQPEVPNNPRDNIHEVAADIRASAQHFAGSGSSQNNGAGNGGAANGYRRGYGRMWIGLIIVAAGVVALVNQLFPLYWVRWEYFWPVILIIIGVAVMSRDGQRQR